MLHEIDYNNFPYMENGRWYKFFVESDGSTSTLTTSDLEGATLSGVILTMPENFHIIDVVYDFNSVESATVGTVAVDIRLEKSGKQSTTIAQATNFDYGYVYIFGHFS